ncbi:hypothetical protein EPYR_03901 [Erwinia pyrifoliae DSM 12163]|uniref:Uncharacterized protein n=1 Tax=Erwinia pyrifoliae TaxID=79967 RepID=A0ABY5X860_ERWPY|nr:hypothetical protein [Erwinia pyrifoliae]UWS33585.1 hypothetical protein NYP84_18865 [Erwinia pyrifoliae]CAX57403.1 Putative transcriptional regulator, fragment [Erwinia pyrifoliae Ep1/96]CAY76281.1 hypothetical protein EPYR_03901 [Erwinia pyrifoliae DSM 12163]
MVYQFARRDGAGSDRPGRNAEAGGDAFSLRYIGPDESVLTSTGMYISHIEPLPETLPAGFSSSRQLCRALQRRKK